MTVFTNLLTIILVNILVLKTDAACTHNFNEEKCRIDMVCKDFLTSLTWDEIDANRHPYYYAEPRANCLNIPIINLHGNDVHSIDLVYKSTVEDNLNPLPVFTDIYGNEPNILKIIHGLDLSNNEFEIPPSINNMEYLQEINLSNNMLTIAKLSNIFDLKSLTRIDLSHNNINQITINNNQYVFGYLRQLNLSYNYFVQIPDAVFDGVNNLLDLDMSNNYIESLTPITFEGVKKLIHLNMSHNRITDIRSSFFRFTELETINLSNNRITHINGVEFEKLRSIIEIKLEHNSISSIDKNAFHNLLDLKILTLNNNKLISLDKEIFLNNIAMQTIDISNNKFTTFPKNLFKNNINIENFKILGNALDGALTRGTFEGLKNLKEIDLRNHNITSIEDYAFLGLDKVSSILLNNNKIQTLSKKSFNNLKELNILDLSNNMIGNIDFEKDDLVQLQSLLLKDNNVTKITHEQFSGLNRLQFLDLSNNNISYLEPKSFHSLENVVTIQISKNPLGEVIFENTFEGLNSLPTLDISHTSISSIQNSTFKGMLELKDLNISHSKLKELQFNCFLHIVSVEKIDLSFNFLKSFDINTTDLSNLNTLHLNNNLIKFLTSSSFTGLHTMIMIDLAHNDIESLETNTFKNQDDLRFLDLSYNTKLRFNSHLIRTMKHLQNLVISAIDSNFTFSDINKMSISSIDLSKLGIIDINKMKVNKLENVITLILKQNAISKLKIGDFSNMTELRDIDLSHNNISFVQPGTFKDNVRLQILNLSHNSLTTLAYGIFRGLNFMNTLDISYNFINSLASERFYEVPSLNNIIADHNLITNIDVDHLHDTILTLSIGENPIPCGTLVKINKEFPRVRITAINLHDREYENVYGVSCNTQTSDKNPTLDRSNENYNKAIFIEIRDILTRISNRNDNIQHNDVATKTEVNLTELVNHIERSFNDSSNNLANKIEKKLNDNSLIQINTDNETNLILKKILNALSAPDALLTTTTPAPIAKENATLESILTYLNKINSLETTLTQYKQTMFANITELANKLAYLDAQLQLRSSITDMPEHEKLVSANVPESKSYFTETCVSMILVIMVGLILFQIYKSKVFIRKRWSMSTNQLPDAMENSNL